MPGGINTHKTIVGTYAYLTQAGPFLAGFVWWEGEMVPLSDITGEIINGSLIYTANDINDFGQVTGAAFNFEDGMYGYIWTPEEIEVQIDIKPGDYPNYINNNGHGVIPVAIFGNVNFDVSTIDPGTVSLEGIAVKTVGNNNTALANYEDGNSDGFQDLFVQIEDTEIVFEEGQTTATLTGNVDSGVGMRIQDSDDIIIVP